MTKTQTYSSWAAQIVAAAILAMAMFPKFTGDPQAITTFTPRVSLFPLSFP